MEPSEQTEFGRQLRTALAHLYDHAYLERHPLAGRFVPAQSGTTHTRGQELRRLLLDAIEALNPGPNVAIRAPERRPYAILFGLYVEGRGQPEVASSLGVGTRQLRRDRAAAIEALARMLADGYAQTDAMAAAEPLRLESERLAPERGSVDIGRLVEELLPLLEGMAESRGVRLASHVAAGLPQPSANRTLLRQALIAVASQALTALPLSRLSFEARPAETTVALGLRLTYTLDSRDRADGAAQRLSGADGPVTTLATALGARLYCEAASPVEESVWLQLPLHEEVSVLVVDDNRELFALFERYVAGQPYRLVHAASADQALALARAAGPAIITIDLMMPGRDGWELLQALRVEPATARTPVIVCSVLEEPELALSLGAQACLKKPVGQAELLRALEAMKEQAWAQEGHPGLPASS